MALLTLFARENRIDTPSAAALFAVSLVFTLTATASVVLRFLAKRINKTSIFIEDYLCVSSLIFVVLQFVCLVLQIQLGGDGHTDVSMEDTARTFQILIAYQSLYCLAVATAKSSIVFFYVRIFGISRTFRIVAYCLVAFIAAWAIMSVLVAFLSCHPFAFTWDQSIPNGYCDNEQGSFVAEAVLDLVADICVFAMPLRPISKLQINNGKRLALFVIFGLGITTMIMAILRIYGLSELNFMAFQTSAVPPLIYSILEPAIGISVACIPLLQPLIQNTWLGQRLATRGTTRSRRAYKPNSSGMKRLDGDDNELRLFEHNSVNVSGGKGTMSEREGSELSHDGAAHGIRKTERFTVSHVEIKNSV